MQNNCFCICDFYEVFIIVIIIILRQNVSVLSLKFIVG